MSVHIEMTNLARAEDRRIHMRPELERAGLDLTFHPAFDFTEHDEADILARCKREGPWGTFHTPNMAATISHAQAWERFLATDATHCLVMEDDIFIAPELGAWLADLNWWPDDADIMKLERWRSKSTKVLLEEHAIMHRGRKVQRLLSRHMGAAGYMLSRDAARKLLAAQPFDMVIDHILFNINASRATRGMNIYQISPAMILQGNEPEGSPFYMGERKRPKGMALVRQKLKRLYYELAYPASTYIKWLTRQARLRTVAFAKDAQAEHQT
ncbi:glycosyltransferase family 25 protein [uncultured Sulfitobacter sp.]|uniref:glycosyltransferase family 25 protein n=1 Tax=uncultured Sulfitobacter sp. TaxID=191468 RepID=UPI0026038139|nr:glycosyltransferase family 25 protein [uncultured Sulfitobacter sp.]